MKFHTLFFFFFCILNLFSQEEDFRDWLPHEVEYYKNLKGLAEYVNARDKSDISKDTLFKKYIYVDSDTLKHKGTLYDMENFDTIFSFIPATIKKVGIQNLDAKPLRFYKQHEIYRPFQSALKRVVPFVMVYYRKERPDEPLGTLLFEPKTHKLHSWILLSQGDSGWYYL
ncbi:hypothetical protein [Ulvibacterium marinum]|nr:hypothetical protein [Ulvibacterium marinum]